MNVVSISKPFTYNKNEINEEFLQEKYKDFRKWYFTFYTDEQQLLNKQFYDFIDKYEHVIPFAL